MLLHRSVSRLHDQEAGNTVIGPTQPHNAPTAAESPQGAEAAVECDVAALNILIRKRPRPYVDSLSPLLEPDFRFKLCQKLKLVVSVLLGGHADLAADLVAFDSHVDRRTAVAAHR